MKKISLILILIVNCAISTAQFTVIPTNTTEILRNITKLDSLYFVQNYGSLFISTSDTFKTLQPLSIPFNINYENKLVARNGKMFVMSSNFNTDHTQFWVSKNYGNSWELRYDTLGFYSSDFIMFDTLDGATLSGFYYRYGTSNGGYNWQYNLTNSMGGLFIKDFADSMSIWTSPEKVYITYNRYNSFGISNCSDLLNPMDAFIISYDTILITSLSQGNYFVYTTDSAQSWHSVETSPFSGRGMYFFNGHEGYVVGRDYAAGQGAVYKTTDMGQTWIKYYTGIDCILQDITFLNDSIALITGTNGVLLKWNKHSAPTSVEDIGDNTSYSLAPNPATTQHTLTIQSKQYDKQAVCTMYDYSGRSIAQYTIKPNGDNTYKLVNDISKLANGMYYYKVQLGVEEYMIKFIITH